MNDELWPSILALASTAYALHLVIGAIARQVRGEPDIEPPPLQPYDVRLPPASGTVVQVNAPDAPANCVNCGAPASEPVCGFCGTRH